MGCRSLEECTVSRISCCMDAHWGVMCGINTTNRGPLTVSEAKSGMVGGTVVTVVPLATTCTDSGAGTDSGANDVASVLVPMLLWASELRRTVAVVSSISLPQKWLFSFQIRLGRDQEPPSPTLWFFVMILCILILAGQLIHTLSGHGLRRTVRGGSRQKDPMKMLFQIEHPHTVMDATILWSLLLQTVHERSFVIGPGLEQSSCYGKGYRAFVTEILRLKARFCYGKGSSPLSITFSQKYSEKIETIYKLVLG